MYFILPRTKSLARFLNFCHADGCKMVTIFFPTSLLGSWCFLNLKNSCFSQFCTYFLQNSRMFIKFLHFNVYYIFAPLLWSFSILITLMLVPVSYSKWSISSGRQALYQFYYCVCRLVPLYLSQFLEIKGNCIVSHGHQLPLKIKEVLLKIMSRQKA